MSDGHHLATSPATAMDDQFGTHRVQAESATIPQPNTRPLIPHESARSALPSIAPIFRGRLGAAEHSKKVDCTGKRLTTCRIDTRTDAIAYDLCTGRRFRMLHEDHAHGVTTVRSGTVEHAQYRHLRVKLTYLMKRLAAR